MPLQNTSGNNTTDAYGGGAAAVPNYIEDVFSTWLVTPASSNTTYSVTNGIDVSGKGGMVWMKSRSSADNNLLYDTARGASAGSNNALISNSSSGQQTANFDYITGLSNGFTVNFATGGGQLTNNGINYASWTFRKQPKFFPLFGGVAVVTKGDDLPPNGRIVKPVEAEQPSTYIHQKRFTLEKI